MMKNRCGCVWGDPDSARLTWFPGGARTVLALGEQFTKAAGNSWVSLASYSHKALVLHLHLIHAFYL